MNNKKRNGKNRNFYILNDRFNMLNHLSKLTNTSNSSFLNMLISKTYNSIHSWNEVSDLNKSSKEIDDQITELQKKKAEISEKLDIAVKINAAQQEFKSKIESNIKENKDRYIKILIEKIVCDDGPVYIMERANEFSTLLSGQWTKEELITEAMLKSKTLPQNEVSKIKNKRIELEKRGI